MGGWSLYMDQPVNRTDAALGPAGRIDLPSLKVFYGLTECKLVG